MTLNVKIVDKSTKEEIKINGTIVMGDETLWQLKDKLHVYTGDVGWYPPIVKVEVGSNTVISENNSILFYTDEDRVYVSSLLDEISEIYTSEHIMTILKSDDRDLFMNTYEELKKSYIDLTEDDLVFVLQTTLMHVDKIAFGGYEEDVTRYLEYIEQKRTNKSDALMEREDSLATYYKQTRTLKEAKEYFETDTSGQPKFGYTMASMQIKGNNFVPGVQGRFIKLDSVFNVFELDNTVPFMAIKGESDANPMIKVYNDVLQDVTGKDFKSWILNEKKKYNVLSYKKVKGLLFKVKIGTNLYVTIALQHNGVMTAKLQLPEEDARHSVDEIVGMIKGGVDLIAGRINALNGVFLRAKKIMMTSESQCSIDGLNGSIVALLRLDLGAIKKILEDEALSGYVFEHRPTVSDMLSIYYKKFGKREVEDNENERKGITVNIKDNPFRLNSSIITVYGAYHVNQMRAIVEQLIAVSKMPYEKTRYMFDKEHKLKAESNIKMLRNVHNVNMDSKKCQYRRQPKVNTNDKPLGDSYKLEHDGNEYICPSKQYSYPGFLNDNSICCFGKDQRRRDVYIRNIKSGDLDLMIQPSNFMIKVTDPSKQPFDTLVVRMASEMENPTGTYYFISMAKDLVAIKNKHVVARIQKQEAKGNMWLGEISFAKLVTGPPKNKCNAAPNMNATMKGDVNVVCKHHKKNKTFGYSLNSYPCCFDSERKVIVEGKQRVVDVAKQYIIRSDKILEFHRLGDLPMGMEKLFNNGGETYFRMGVLQNETAFLNAVLLALGFDVGGKKVSNTNDFIRMLVEVVTKSDVFNKLNGGNVAIRYANTSSYVDMLTTGNLSWIDMLDLVQRVCGVNIVTLEVPYKSSEMTKTPDYENTKIVCNPFIKSNARQPYIIMIKRLKTFELVVRVKKTKDERADIQSLFKYSQSVSKKESILNMLVDYHSASCVRENVYPEEFKYDELYSFVEVQEALRGTDYDVKAQVLNVFNKVEYALANGFVLIPVRESGIVEGVPTATTAKLTEKRRLLRISEYTSGINAINKIFHKRGKGKIILKGATVDRDDNTTAVLTSMGVLVPVKKEKYTVETGLELLDYKYYSDVNESLGRQGTNINKQVMYTTEMRELKELLFNVKTQLAGYISNNTSMKAEIERLNKATIMTRQEKMTSIVAILGQVPLAEKITKSKKDFLYNHIANEILNDNVENLLLNNLVVSEFFDPNKVIQRDRESVLVSIDDIVRWLKRFTRVE